MLNLIFPNVCPICESATRGKAVCDGCMASVKFIREMAVCVRCGLPFDFFPSESDQGHFCGRCLFGEFRFHKARSAAYYDGALREMLHRFKYEGKLNIGGVISGVLMENFPADLDGFDVILPVPLYIGKLRKREYNQSAILGMNLSKRLRVFFDPFTLRKIRDTKPQFEVKGLEERKKNVKGAFSVANPDKIRNKSVLIVDDVFTTGSTLDECAATLLGAGAIRVQAVTLMRAVQD